MPTPTTSLSTMWAQQERFADMRAFAQAAQAFGYDSIEVSHVTDEAGLECLLDGSGAPLSSIHAPAPKVSVNGKPNSDLNLASLDEQHRRTALEHTRRTIDYAATAGARFVVVHLGGVGDEMFESERKQRRLFDAGTRSGDEYEALRRETVERRVDQAPPYLEKAQESLAELVAYASERGIALGLESRLHHHEIPLVDEAQALFDDYPADQAGYWHDVGHTEVQSRLGYVDKRHWLDALGPRTLGAHLHDVEGIGDHRAPGNGDVDWEYIARGLPADALRVFEINQRQPDDAVAGALAFLRQRGVVG